MIKKIAKFTLCASLIFGVASYIPTSALYTNYTKFFALIVRDAKFFGRSPERMKDPVKNFINFINYKGNSLKLFKYNELMTLKKDGVTLTIYATLNKNFDFKNNDNLNNLFTSIPKMHRLIIRKYNGDIFNKNEIDILNNYSEKNTNNTFYDEGIPFYCKTTNRKIK